MSKFYEKYIKNNIDIFISIFLATVFYILVFGIKSLNPANYNWLLYGGDLTQNYLGGAVYRASPWSWPIFVHRSIGYPYGVSVLGTDSLPIMAIIFKCFTHFFGLSPYYQFFGIWTLLCLILQAFFAVKILRKIFGLNSVYNIICSLFFITAPILINRAFAHATLVGHWIILASILLYLNDKLNRKEWFYIGLIMNISFMVHPYFTFMISPIIAALVYKKVFTEKEITIKTTFKYGSITTLSLVITMYMLGMFEVANPSAGGWRSLSMNLNALLNPIWSRSLFLNQLGHSSHMQQEGCNYLGVGLLLALVMAILSSRKKIFSKEKFLKNKEILIACLFLTIFAVSSNIYLGNSLIFSYNSLILRALGGIFRAAGRMFWPVWYLLVYFILCKLNEQYKEKVRFIIPFLCIIQLLDLSPNFIDKNKKIKNSINNSKGYQNILQSTKWNDLFNDYKHVFITDLILGNDNYRYFWEKVITSGITVNAGYFTRETLKIKRGIETCKNLIYSGYLPDTDNTMYIIDDEFYSKLVDTNNRLVPYIKELDGIKYILSNKELFKSKDSIRFGEKIYFVNSNKEIVFDGFSSENEQEYWTVHHHISMNFKMAEQPKDDFKIKLDVVPFINDYNKYVRAKVVINGKKVAKWVFKKGKQYPETILYVPKKLIKSDGNVEIKFHMMGTNSEKRLGIGKDVRRKGIGLASMEIVY